MLNVLSGEVSLAGPRPIVGQEIQKYRSYFKHYCRVRPSLTGIYQWQKRHFLSATRHHGCGLREQ
ncbi:sugar transferase [Novosphingobium sp.]|uniref:sugar transferase n=1 Tax=Novosphingobium sp. TaxID=1874826 RepID=UPI003D6CAF9A